MRNIDPVLHERLKKLIDSMGYELVGCEMLQQGQQLVFGIYIDTPNGVTVEDCSKVSRQVSAMFDVDNLMQSKYVLEVSSPGIDRPLFEPGHYRQQVGKQVKIKLYSAINQRRQYQGILQRVEEDRICLQLDTTEEVELPFSAIARANVIGDIKK